MLAARGRRLPFVTTLHGTDITLVGLDRSYLPITRYAIQESDGVTSISEYLREKTLADFGVTRDIAVVPNFVNCNVYDFIRDEAVRDEARLRYAKPGEAILMHLSNFRPVKRVTDVVKVFAKINKEVPSQLLLVGDGPDRSAAEYLAHDLCIHSRIHFLGKQERVNELLPIADLMIMPSEMESFGLAALEAMACKVPTIATRVGGVGTYRSGVPACSSPSATWMAWPPAPSTCSTTARAFMKCAKPAAATRKNASAPRSSSRNTCSTTSPSFRAPCKSQTEPFNPTPPEAHNRCALPTVRCGHSKHRLGSIHSVTVDRMLRRHHVFLRTHTPGSRRSFPGACSRHQR
jgi:hypothetical protein